MTDKAMHLTCLALGSNLGDCRGNVTRAMDMIKELVGCIVRRSALYVTEPWGFDSDNMFVNAVVLCSTRLSPHELLAVTQDIERTMGRRSKSVDGMYHDRVIDIDILLYDDDDIDLPGLRIPHPLMWQRSFVVEPLAEILPGIDSGNHALSAFATADGQVRDSGRSGHGGRNV